MTNRKKVISEFEHLLNDAKGNYQDFVDLTVDAGEEILVLLKEQDAVEPIISESYRTNSGRMSRRKAWCGACGIGINFDAKFCDHCGKAVKWV